MFSLWPASRVSATISMGGSGMGGEMDERGGWDLGGDSGRRDSGGATGWAVRSKRYDPLETCPGAQAMGAQAARPRRPGAQAPWRPGAQSAQGAQAPVCVQAPQAPRRPSPPPP